MYVSHTFIVIQNIKGAETTVASTVARSERGGNKTEEEGRTYERISIALSFSL